MLRASWLLRVWRSDRVSRAYRTDRLGGLGKYSEKEGSCSSSYFKSTACDQYKSSQGSDFKQQEKDTHIPQNAEVKLNNGCRCSPGLK